MRSKFIHLRLRTNYSLSRSSVKIENIAPLCHRYNMPAVAITDENNLFASLESAVQISSNGIQPIIGSLIKVIDGELHANLLLLSTSEIGYRNLLKIVSFAYIKNKALYNEAVSTLEDLSKYSEGIIALSGYTDGLIGQSLLNKQKDKAEEYALKLNYIFKDSFYMEIMRHDLPEQKDIEEDFINLAYKLNIPIVATNDIYFETKDMYEAHDILICISECSYYVDEKRPRIPRDCYFKSAEEMTRLFRDIPEAIENSVNIARRCHYMPTSHAPMLPDFASHAEDESKILRLEAEEGLKIKLEEKFKNELITSVETQATIYEEYKKRLDYELEIIISMQFSGYFLIVSDFIKWSKNNNISVGPGRGSGAGAVVAWCLLITDLDPIKFGLIFERFLNPERISMPDFDIDFCQERREEVLDYVRNKYGNSRVGQIITFGKLQARAVIRDVGRVLQIPYNQVDRISKLIPFNAVNPVTLSQAIEIVPELSKLYRQDDILKNLFDIALKLEGLNRHASIHAAGIIISGVDLINMVPLYKEDKSDMLIIQYSMKYAELAGLVKFDFLGLKTLTLIRKTIVLIEELNNIKLDISTRFDDKKTYELLTSGRTSGVFQFESRGMQDSLRKIKPDAIEDIIALGALYRPGPMENIPTYIACKHGHQAPNYLHEALTEVLRETFGVIIYQEQVLKIAQILAGYSLGAADLLRKAMGKKIKSEMDAQRATFIEGSLKKGLINKEQANHIFDFVAKFAGYGFNKSHAASYAVISYQTAFLKANYPVEFLVVSMNLELDDSDKINLFIQDAKALNIKLIAPDINISEGLFSIETDSKAIKFALAALKGIGVHAAEEIVRERNIGGNFKDIFDFAKRMPAKILNKKLLESLIKAGAFDSLNSNRKQLIESVEIILKYGSHLQAEKNSNQFSLFTETEEVKNPTLQQYSDFSSEEKANLECEVIGFYLERHPLMNFKSLFYNLGLTDINYIKEELAEGDSGKILAGIILSSKARLSPRGRYLILNISDPSGNLSLFIFNDEIINNRSHLFNEKRPLIFTLDIKKDEGGLRINIKDIFDINEYISQTKITLTLNIKETKHIPKVLEILKSSKNNKGVKVYLSLKADIYNNILLEMPGYFGIDKLLNQEEYYVPVLENY